MPLQWRNQFWPSLEEGAVKRCSECVCVCVCERDGGGGGGVMRTERSACAYVWCRENDVELGSWTTRLISVNIEQNGQRVLKPH